MKKIFNYSIAVIAAVAAVSCAKELEIEQTGNVSGQENKIVFTLPASKTMLHEGKTVWVEGDKILITDGTNSETLTVPEASAGSNTVELSTALSGKLYAIYPVAAAASTPVVEGQVSLVVPGNQDGMFASANICAAVSENYKMAMRNVTAVVSVNAAMDVDGLVLSAPEDALAGSFTVDLSGSDPVITKKSTTGVISVDAAGGGDTYYAAVIPGTYKAGFSLTALNLKGEFETKTTTAEKTLAINELADMGEIGDDMSGLEGSGTEGEPFQINNLAELTAFAYSVNLGNSYEGKFLKVINDIEGGLTIPVGTCADKVDYYFRGNFDGNGKTITLAIDGVNCKNINYVGLFGEVGEGANIHNVTVDGSVTTTGDCAAGLIGCVNAGAGVTVANCVNKASVTGNRDVAGIIGYADATAGENSAPGELYITNCTNMGEVVGKNSVSGIVGYVKYAKISGCTNAASVTSDATAISQINDPQAGTIPSSGYASWDNGTGSIAGFAQNSVLTGCSNTGAVSAIFKVGGIVGTSYWSTVATCVNGGSVTGTYHYGNNTGSQSGASFGSVTGGIIGWVYASSVVNSCNNNGTINGKSGTGGIVGLITCNSSTSSYPTVKECVNTGNVISTDNPFGGTQYTNNAGTGGICGSTAAYARGNSSDAKYHQYPTITDCVNKGDVTTSSIFGGGILGHFHNPNKGNGYWAYSGYILGCENFGNVTAKFYVGGLVGAVSDRYAALATIKNSCNHGKVTATGICDKASIDASKYQGAYAGGLVGGTMSWNASYRTGKSTHLGLYNSYNDGDVVYSAEECAYPYVGGLVGQFINSGGVQNCYSNAYVGTASHAAPVEGADAYIGTLVGKQEYASAKWAYFFGTADMAMVGSSGASAVMDPPYNTCFDDGGMFPDGVSVLVGGEPYNNVTEAMDAWVVYYPTGGYKNWTDGPKGPVFDE